MIDLVSTRKHNRNHQQFSSTSFHVKVVLPKTFLDSVGFLIHILK